jgi:hypothetical protein
MRAFIISPKLAISRRKRCCLFSASGAGEASFVTVKFDGATFRRAIEISP